MNGKKRTTTRDIAKACFVSQSAVSMILSGREDIHFATETIERVKRTAKEMGYEYRGRAKEKDRDKRYDYDHVSFSSNTVLYNIDSVYYAGSAGTWVVYADSLYESFKRKRRILP